MADEVKTSEPRKVVKDAGTSLAAFFITRKGETNMGFQIEVKTGDAGPVILRGCADGTIEFCKWAEVTDPKTKIKGPGLVAYKWYTSIEHAFERVFRMRAASCDAQNIKDLVAGIKQIRADIKQEMGVISGV